MKQCYCSPERVCIWCAEKLFEEDVKMQGRNQDNMISAPVGAKSQAEPVSNPNLTSTLDTLEVANARLGEFIERMYSLKYRIFVTMDGPSVGAGQSVNPTTSGNTGLHGSAEMLHRNINELEQIWVQISDRI